MDLKFKDGFCYYNKELLETPAIELIKPSIKRRFRWIIGRINCFFTGGHSYSTRSWVNKSTGEILEYHKGCRRCPKFEIKRFPEPNSVRFSVE